MSMKLIVTVNERGNYQSVVAGYQGLSVCISRMSVISSLGGPRPPALE